MYCPVCYREISVTSSGRIRRHGFKKDRWNTLYVRVDSKACKGSGRTGLSSKEAEPIVEELRERK